MGRALVSEGRLASDETDGACGVSLGALFVRIGGDAFWLWKKVWRSSAASWSIGKESIQTN